MKFFWNWWVVIFFTIIAAEDVVNPFSDEFIEWINAQESTWTAGRNFDVNTPRSRLLTLVGTFSNRINSMPERNQKFNISKKIHSVIATPEFFDARQQWPECRSIGTIMDQGACASAWAISVTQVMSDRICITSRGTLPLVVSAQDLLSCSQFVFFSDGCLGYIHLDGWDQWRHYGIVTGGGYESLIGCKAYELAPCNGTETCNDFASTPSCIRVCDANSRRIYDEDLTVGTGYWLNEDEEQIKFDIMTFGPVSAMFYVYEDFVNYKSGVYHHLETSSVVDIHSVRILGWGVENSIPYWLVANSWGTQWGDDGYFKILRGSNELDIENLVVAGLPIL